VATVFILVVVMLVVCVALRRKETLQAHAGTRGASGREHTLYQKLLRKSLGDHGLVERLIALESEKHPHARRVVWMQHAIDAWERDNR
jgi:hypothetical protein